MLPLATNIAPETKLKIWNSQKYLRCVSVWHESDGLIKFRTPFYWVNVDKKENAAVLVSGVDFVYRNRLLSPSFPSTQQHSTNIRRNGTESFRMEKTVRSSVCVVYLYIVHPRSLYAHICVYFKYISMASKMDRWIPLNWQNIRLHGRKKTWDFIAIIWNLHN